jgi:hypothetical protein
MNPTLDRGPAAFEFESGREDGTNGKPASVKRVIDLTPKFEDTDGVSESLSPTRPVPDPPLPGIIGNERPAPAVPSNGAKDVEILPEPMQDSGSLEILPPTIEESLDS